MIRSSIPNFDPSFGRVLEMGRALTEEAVRLGLSASKEVRLPVFGTIQLSASDQEAATRTFIVSYAQPQASSYNVECWVNPINKRIFKSIPSERTWKLILTRIDLFLEANALEKTTTTSDAIGQPVADITQLLMLDTVTIPDKSMYYVEAEHAIYALDLQGTDPIDPPNVFAPASGPGRWYRITSNTAVLGNIDGGIF